jgi:hypothetical protein
MLCTALFLYGLMLGPINTRIQKCHTHIGNVNMTVYDRAIISDQLSDLLERRAIYLNSLLQLRQEDC